MIVFVALDQIIDRNLCHHLVNSSATVIFYVSSRCYMYKIVKFVCFTLNYVHFRSRTCPLVP